MSGVRRSIGDEVVIPTLRNTACKGTEAILYALEAALYQLKGEHDDHMDDASPDVRAAVRRCAN